uniref:Uncharacterized protein n=1 Tax=Strongyloides stercoralis TaxID=6248 RepID=A0AAF5DHV4_STRER
MGGRNGIRCEMLTKLSGPEAYIKDILMFLKKTLILLQDESCINAKLALFSINIRDYIDKVKKLVETIKITDSKEVIINEDEVENDQLLPFYIPFEKTISLLIKRLEIYETNSLNIILYSDDIQTNNSLGSHTKTGSFLHIAYKLHFLNNFNVIKKCSKLDSIMTLGIVLSEVTKFFKYDWLLALIKKMLVNLNIVHINKQLSLKIFCFCGDHSFLQEVFNVPKSFKGEVEERDFKNLKACEEANDDEVLKGERFSSVMEYPLNEYSDPFHDILEGILANVIFCIVKKIKYFNSQYRRLSSTAINWNPIEMEKRRFNKRNKCQN